MSIDKTAIEHIQKTATDLREVENTDFPTIALSESLKLHDLEKYQQYRNYFRGIFETKTCKDFLEYVSENKGANCFINADSMSAKSIFDLGDKESPGHAKHQANLTLKKSAPYIELLANNETRMNQRELAEWIEDYRDFIEVLDENGEEMQNTAAVAAIRRITIEAIRKQGNEQRTFGESKSAMESIDAKSEDGPMPAWILFTCKPYEDLKEQTFHSRISITTRGDEPKLTMRIIKLDVIKEEMATEFKELLAKEHDGDMKFYLGNFTA